MKSLAISGSAKHAGILDDMKIQSTCELTDTRHLLMYRIDDRWKAMEEYILDVIGPVRFTYSQPT